MSTELFAKEQAILDRARAALATSHQEFESLAVGYERLLKQVRRLVQISDRSEERLKDANLLIEQQKLALEKANEEISRHAELLEVRVRERTRELAAERAKLERLVRIGITLGGVRDGAVLQETILEGALELSGADGAVLYFLDDNALIPRLARIDSLGLRRGGTLLPLPDLPAVPLRTEAGRPNDKDIVAAAVQVRRSLVVDDAYDQAPFDLSLVYQLDLRLGYRTRSLLAVPLIPRGAEVIGVLLLLNARDADSGAITGFSAETRRIVEALASQAAVSIDNYSLLEIQGNLLESFIELIAGAIDAKSPHTGGHCARVPEIAQMVAEAASVQAQGPFAAFALTSEDEWREFRIAAWLHDCGKVTTPEYVVDKATKLETLYNRIHEVRTRFEVLWREADIAYWRALAQGEADEASLARERDALKATLQDEFAFVAQCNIGGEFMAPADLERLQVIAGRTWTRYFDDTLGLAHLEVDRLPPDHPAPPVEEPLLADRPEHRVSRPSGETFLPDARMDIPAYLYNFGELYNLSIRRGTLTEEERFKINDHVVQTIAMLRRLSFPKSLRRVPEYAGAHHETLAGTGYPRRLRAEEMSVPARIIALADIFEALTAADRPYKKAKSLGEALKIMAFMARDRHIDPDLFDLLLESGIYRLYAESYLLPEQLGPIDLAALRGIVHGTP
ncbi:HD family phosphohydrolase [Pararhodospirillum photometricum]|nr:HD family phosphohydrolase [Pararhodospirillum photometricum]